MLSKSKVTVKSLGGGSRWSKLRFGLLVLVIVLLTVAGTLYEISAQNARNAAKAANAADQIALEKSLQASTDSSNDPSGVIYTADRLISGQKSGMFTISNNDLAQMYLDRGNAFMQLKQYQNVINSYELAVKLNNTIASQAIVLPVEIQAKYMLGARKELIPLYQELLTLAEDKNNHDPYSLTRISGYQSDIQALQNNQEIQF